jgi:hypothetical protein
MLDIVSLLKASPLLLGGKIGEAVRQELPSARDDHEVRGTGTYCTGTATGIGFPANFRFHNSQNSRNDTTNETLFVFANRQREYKLHSCEYVNFSRLFR